MDRVIFCGGRKFRGGSQVVDVLMELDPNDTIIVHGDAKGADRLADFYGKQMGFRVEAYPADWKQHGMAAGTMRNLLMARLPNVVHVYAFKGGTGTEHMVTTAKGMGIEVTRVQS